MRTRYRMSLAEYEEATKRFIDLRRFEPKQATPSSDPGNVGGWIPSMLVWAAVIAMLLAVVAALLGPAE